MANSVWNNILRNKYIFQNEWEPDAAIIAKATKLAKKVLVVCCKMNWLPPSEHWVKVNCNGAFSETTRRVACGGVIWDDRG